MSHALRFNRHSGRRRPRLEGLEARLALSASPWFEPPLDLFLWPPSNEFTGPDYSMDPSGDGEGPSDFTTTWPDFEFNEFTDLELGPELSVIATSPEPGAALRSPFNAFSVTFDRPLDPFSIFYFDDVRLERLGENGEWARPYDAFNAPVVSVGPDGSTLSFTAAASFTAGNYRLVIPAGSVLAGRDGATLADPFEDRVVGTFTVEGTGLGLADATDVGGIGNVPVVVSGELSFLNDAREVRLYRFTVAEGHRWRLGAEVAAQRDGSTLAATLSLFDGQGRLIATTNQGRPDAPDDPYLFAGLTPGVYYLGVSGRTNVPGAPEGYDLAEERLGATSDPSQGGSFRLAIVADPADAPVRLVGFSLQWADPSLAAPTGFALTFSGALDIAGILQNPSGVVELIGQDGVSHSVTAIGLNEQGAQYHFLIDEPLPAGRYEVRLVAGGGLTDLSGLAPTGILDVAVPGSLAKFEVSRKAASPRGPKDLGSLYQQVKEGLTFTDVVLPRSAVTYRFVAVTEGLYRINAPDATGALVARFLGADGLKSVGLVSGQPSFQFLKSGVYYLQLVNPGNVPVRVGWELLLESNFDSILENGIGQGPALGLRLASPGTTGVATTAPALTLGPTYDPSAIAPNPGSGGGGGPFGPVGPASPVGPNGAPGLGGSSSGVATGFGPASAAIFLSFADSPVGMPAAHADHVAAVGPTANALASNGVGLLQGISYGQSIVESPSSGDAPDADLPLPERHGPLGFDPGDPPVEPKAGPADADLNGALVEGSTSKGSKADEAAIAAADWLAEVGGLAAKFFGAGIDDAAEPEAPVATVAVPIALVHDDALPRSAGRVEKASINAPMVVGLGAAMAMRFVPTARRWARRKAAGPVASTKANPYAGPHRPR